MLGERMDDVAFVIKGNTSKKAAVRLVGGIIKALGMHKTHQPICYEYPINGKGGKGYTYISPITESYVIFDAWPDMGGAYLKILSCKTVSLVKVAKKIRALRYKIKQIEAKELRLKNGV